MLLERSRLMLLAHISHPTTYLPFTGNRIWRQALEWIENNADASIGGIFELQGKDMYVNVHGYETLSDHLCRFESHRQYVDLQYCISGGERIEWLPTTDLKADGEYDRKKDFQYYETEKSGSILSFTPGTFGIFFPEDAHKPKMVDGVNSDVWKLVVKINLSLLKDD